MKGTLFIFLLVFAFLSSCTEPGITSSNDSSPLLRNNPKQTIITSTPTMTLSPFKIVLKARNAPEIGFVYGGVLPYGYSISDFDLDIYFNQTEVASAIEFRYCAIDNNFLGRFERSDIVNNTYVMTLQGQTVTVIVKGTYTISNGNGDTQIIDVDKWDYAEIK